MKRNFATVAATLGLIIGAMAFAPAAPAVTDNGTGIFWLYDGAGGTGAWRDFNNGPGRNIDISAMTFTNGTSMNNKVSSIKYSCGSSGSAIDQGDMTQFFDANNNTIFLQQIDPNYPGACSGGVITINLSAGATNRASSIKTWE